MVAIRGDAARRVLPERGMIFQERMNPVNYSCGLKMMLTGMHRQRVRDHLYEEGTSNYAGAKKEIGIGIRQERDVQVCRTRDY